MDYRTKVVEVYGLTVTAKFRTSHYMGPGRVYERSHVVAVWFGLDTQVIDEVGSVLAEDFISEIENEIDLMLRDEADENDTLTKRMGFDEPDMPFLRRVA